MAGTITHKWNGTILTITSDSGTSSADLKGEKGDDGVRGPAGVPGECKVVEALERAETAAATVEQCYKPIIIDVVSDAILINDAAHLPFRELHIYGTSSQNGTPTPAAPIDIDSVEDATLSHMGKSLIPFPFFNMTKSINGIKYEVDSEGYITATGTLKNTAQYSNYDIYPGRYGYKEEQFTLPVGTFTLTVSGAKDKSKCYAVLYRRNAAGSYLQIASTKNKDAATITTTKQFSDYYLTLACEPAYNPVGDKILISLSGTIGAAEAYKEAVKIALPFNLYGIPTEGSGTYKDNSGQGWLSDEYNAAANTITRRTRKITFDGTEAEWSLTNGLFTIAAANLKADKAISNRYVYSAAAATSGEFNTEGGNLGFNSGEATVDAWKAQLAAWAAAEKPLTVVFLLNEEETEVLEANAGLMKDMLYNPNNSFISDKKAGFAASYCADTKAYIDNKFTELATAVVALGG